MGCLNTFVISEKYRFVLNILQLIYIQICFEFDQCNRDNQVW